MIPDNIKKQHVLQALKEIDNEGVPDKRESTKFSLVHENKKYPPKYVISIANKYANDEKLVSDKFSGGKEANTFLEDLGFKIRVKLKDLDPLLIAYEKFYESDLHEQEQWKFDFLDWFQDKIVEQYDLENLSGGETKNLIEDLKSLDGYEINDYEDLNNSPPILLLGGGQAGGTAWNSAFLKYTKDNSEKASKVLSKLFDEDIDIQKRLSAFIDFYREASEHSRGQYISLATILLSLTKPSNYIIYKYTEFKEFFEKFTEIDIEQNLTPYQYSKVNKAAKELLNRLSYFENANMMHVQDLIWYYRSKDFYWVTQTKDEEIEQNYIQAPATTDHHGHNLEKVQGSGSIIFHYDNRRDGEIIGYSEPIELKEFESEDEKYWRIEVDFHEFDKPIKLNEVLDQLYHDRDKKYFPINKKKELNEQYLSELTHRAGQYLFKYLEDKEEANKMYKEVGSTKTIEEILNNVFLNQEDRRNARRYLIKLFNYLGDLESIESALNTTYNDGRKKIGVNLGQWQVFSIERTRNDYLAQFAVDIKKLPQDYEEWSELTKVHGDFDKGEENRLLRFQWNKNLLNDHPELEEAWRNSIEFAREEFKNWVSPYNKFHRENIYHWILEGISEKDKKEILLEKNNSDLDFEDMDVTAGLYFPEDMKLEINRSVRSALKSGKNIIFTGPPGTGKTKLAKNVADKVKDNCGCLEDYVFTTATADWTTFDTIGGYHPKKEGSSLSFKAGQFLKCFKDKDGNPVNKWLIIDEINRADIDKAFGQLFSVLTNDNVELPFTDDEGRTISIEPLGTDVDEDGFEYSDSAYYVPCNWRLLATMNTFDKASLYEMSYAFMRRFAFIDVGVPLDEKTEDEAILDRINKYISKWVDLEENDFDESLKLDLKEIWEKLNENKRPIGPAIIRDMLLFLKHHKSEDELVNALKLYVLPQIEGMIKKDQKQIFKSLKEIDGLNEEKLKKVAMERFEIELGDDGE